MRLFLRPPTALSLAAKTSLLYLVFGIGWILLSDSIVNYWVPLQYQEVAQGLKGIFFVSLSSILIFWVMWHESRKSEVAVRQLSWIIEATNLGTWEWNFQTGETRFNERWAEIVGYRLSELQPVSIRTWMNLAHPDDLARSDMELKRHLAGETQYYECECRMRHKDGHWVWVHDKGQVVDWTPQGAPLLISGTHTDITARKQQQDELEIAAAAFDAHTGIIITDENAVIQRVNSAFTRITGYSPEEAVGRNPRFLRSGRHGSAFYREMWQTVAQCGGWQGEVWNRHADGHEFAQWLSIASVRDSSGCITHYVGSISDITARKEAEQQAHELAFYDALTGLANRRLLVDRLDHALAAAQRRHDEPYGAVLMLDLDHFKVLNDTRGHQEGDRLLVEVARRLRDAVRGADTVARLGGDEFVIVLEGIGASRERASLTARHVAEQVCSSLNEPYVLPTDSAYAISASVGITLFGDASQLSTDDILRQADLALYAAKARGRDTACFFDSQLQSKVERRASLERDLRLALSRGELTLHYQPQTDCTGRIIGAETLMRWTRGDGTSVAPAEFIPVAEDTGLITPIGRWALACACQQLRKWAGDAGMRHLRLAVNVSARQFHDSCFVSELAKILKASGTDPSRLKIELTESVVLFYGEDTDDKVSALKELGVGLALDDFGTGFSSLSYLKRLPVDEVKIDTSFVRDLPHDENSASIVRTIVAMGSALGIDTVAEGVETMEQLKFLQARGCTAYQGHLFAKPAPLDVLEALAASKQQCSTRLRGLS